MKTVLITLNAKYIHTSLALRWLYVANRDRFDISFHEYTTKENHRRIIDDMIDSAADIIGLSVYIWNIEQSIKLAKKLKERRPETIIVFGGPEVSYDPAFALETGAVDYVVCGEGEVALGELLEMIERGEERDIEDVATPKRTSATPRQSPMEALTAFASPYLLEGDAQDKPNKLLYFETSRGCPYQCQYCLSSLERGVRYFPMEYVKQNLEKLINDTQVRQIKFLDRTFNLDKERTIEIFETLRKNHRPDLVCQFEVYADILDDQTIDYLNTQIPAGYFRFEIGIQSTHEPTNKAVKRVQNFPKLARNIRRLLDGGKVVLHLDLIAGLPYEDFERFSNSFDDVFALGAEEVQLGFLKLLRGTGLRRDASKLGYEYDPKAPYQITKSNALSTSEIERIHDAEQALEKFWNSGRFPATMHALLFAHQAPFSGRYFEFFDLVGQFYTRNSLAHRGYQLEDLFMNLHQFLLTQGVEQLHTLREDYYGNFTIRPRGYWMPLMDKRTIKQILHRIGQDRAFLEQHGLTRKIVEKKGVIYPISADEVLLTLFLGDARPRYSIKI